MRPGLASSAEACVAHLAERRSLGPLSGPEATVGGEDLHPLHGLPSAPFGSGHGRPDLPVDRPSAVLELCTHEGIEMRLDGGVVEPATRQGFRARSQIEGHRDLTSRTRIKRDNTRVDEPTTEIRAHPFRTRSLRGMVDEQQGRADVVGNLHQKIPCLDALGNSVERAPAELGRWLEPSVLDAVRVE